MESVGSFRYRHSQERSRHQLWIRQDVTPNHGQGRNAFYACGEAFCAVRWGAPGPDAWSKGGSSFFFKNYDDLVEFCKRMQRGFTEQEAQTLLLKRKLILGNLIDKRGEYII